MTATGAAGANYGLKFNWGKLELMSIRCQGHVSSPDGVQIPEKDSMVYLGSVLAADGSIASELSRRLGCARSEFDTLARVWSHSTFTAQRKLHIFEACVQTKLLYGLHAAWLRSTSWPK